MDLKLTDTERLILANQYTILHALQPNEGHDALARQLRDGHAWLYKASFDHLSPVMPDADARFVVDIVDLYSTLKFSFNELEDKGGIVERQVQFPGFDGNNETELMSFAGALSAAGKFGEVLGEPHTLNSHYEAAPGYRRMLGRWAELDKPRTMNADQILDVLNASKHP